MRCEKSLKSFFRCLEILLPGKQLVVRRKNLVQFSSG